VWLLARRYGADRATLAKVIRELLTNDTFVFEDRATLQETLQRFEREPANFADQLIGTAARRLGARFTLTFDRALKKSDLFAVLGV
ncbi:MAG: twitching motility protein PilT, partial [Thermoanaerobaculia bacterium]|nr:twitching motility protein PilT [Thermoanaerobaculia bacterium]